MLANTTKTLVAALLVATASITLVAAAAPAPDRAPGPDELMWMQRASNPNTNGF